MKEHTLKSSNSFVVLIVLILFGITTSNGQSITGTSAVTLGQSYTYYISGISSPYDTNWNVPYGGIITSHTDRQATILWNTGVSVVTANCFDRFENYHSLGLPITLAVTAPATPASPTIYSEACTSAVLQKSGSIPSGVMWYWQGTSSSGTSTTYPATSNYNVTVSGTFYIRAKNTSSGTWSTSSSSVAVTLGDTNCSVSLTLSNENYIYTVMPQEEMTEATFTENEKTIKNITYFDGLGRPMQSIAIGQSGGTTQSDIITHIGYDEFGRQDKDYLPYTAASNGLYRTGAEAATLNYYDTSKYDTDFSGMTTANINPYAQKLFEASPLNRVLEQTAPGDSWKAGTTIDANGHSNGHTIKLDYQSNTTNEVRLYNVNLTFANNTYTPNLVNATTYYLPNELFKSIVKDENWKTTDSTNHTTEEFKDKQGRVVLKRTYNAGAKHDTYYVYDDFGNLTYVLPPKVDTSDGVSSIELSELCYQYKYDQRNRLVEKKIPGKDWESIVYNKLDQPILTQDALLKAQGKWLFTKYDVFGRVAYTGEMTRTITRPNLQTEVTNFSTQYETKNSAASTIDGTTVYYSNYAYPKSYITEILTINYYDDYTFDKDGLSLQSSWDGQVIVNYNDATKSLTKGLATGSKVRVLGTSNWITTITGYDVKGRPIYLASKNNYLATTDVVKSTLDFTGKVDKTTTTHAKIGKSTITTVDTFTYDHAGRLLKQTQAINGASTPEVIVDNSYDELGQLKSKGVGGKTNQSRLQTVDYAYNIRGWLKQINNPVTLGTDLFAFKLNYNTTSHGAAALYNGNISETEWRTANTNNSLHWYKYNYDALNRLTKAEDNLGKLDVTLNYDKNGNINNLTRLGHIVGGNTIPDINNPQHFGTMDNLTYSYIPNTNKLQIVSDTGNDTYGFKDDQLGTGIDNTIDYTYDANGNMITDTNKGITAITYNHLNLPDEVKFGSTNKIKYIYDATGVKLSKKVVESGNNDVYTYYAGNYIYEGSSLKFFNTSEGYVEPNGTGYDYVYQYKDHLGNIRLSYKDISLTSTPQLEIVEENNYYPFGGSHKGYNNVINGAHHPYGFAGKEEQDELGLQWMDFGARNYDKWLGRWMNVDPLADHPNQVDKSPYAYAWNNPVKYTDPDGRCPICPFLVKGATGAGVDYLLQGAFNYAGGMEIGDAFSPSNIDKTDVLISGITGMNPFSVPGGKYGAAAAAAFGDVAINAGKATLNGEDYTAAQAGQDFMIGFAAQLGSEAAGEFFGKYMKKLKRRESYLKWSPNWSTGSFSNTLNKYTPNAKGVKSADGVKTRYMNDDYEVIFDNENNYYRVKDLNRNQYLDVDGNVPSNNVNLNTHIKNGDG